MEKMIRVKSIIRTALAPALLLLLFLQVFSSPAFAIGELVWSVRIEGKGATLARSRFPLLLDPAEKTPRSFPLGTLRVRRLVDKSTYGPDGGGTNLRIRVALLPVRPDGTLAASSLVFVSPERVSREKPGIAPEAFRNQPVLGWESSADGSRAVVQTEFQTLFLITPASGRTDMRIKTTDTRRTFGAVLSDNPERIAAISLERLDPRAPPRLRVRWNDSLCGRESGAVGSGRALVIASRPWRGKHVCFMVLHISPNASGNHRGSALVEPPATPRFEMIFLVRNEHVTLLRQLDATSRFRSYIHGMVAMRMADPFRPASISCACNRTTKGNIPASGSCKN